MKSSILKFVTVASLALAAFGFAQEQTPAKKGRDAGVGVRIAAGYNSMYGFEEEDDDVDGNPSGAGFEGGLTFLMEMVNNLYFVPEVNFSYNSTSHEYLNTERTYKSMNLEIPLMFRGVVAQRFYVNAGPQLVLSLSHDVDAAATYTNPITHKEEKFPYNENIEQGTFTFGIAAGAGVNIIDHVSFDVRFYMGLTELFPDTKSPNDGIGNINNLKNFSMISLAGAKMMSIKAGFNFWFI